MGYLDNSTITVDAILTKRGRELLAMGQSQFRITQFALADDEIDYDLWNPAHPLGSAYYGTVIENMPVTEAVPDEIQSMKYKLLTLPRGAKFIPYIQSDKAVLNVTNNTQTLQKTVRIETNFYTSGTNTTNVFSNNQFNLQGGYTIILLDSTYVGLLPGANTTPVPGMGGGQSTVTTPATSQIVVWKNSGQSGNFIEIVIDTSKIIGISGVKSTKLIVTGNETGGRIVIPITIEDVDVQKSSV